MVLHFLFCLQRKCSEGTYFDFIFLRGVKISLLLIRNQRIVSYKDKPQNEKEVARFCLLNKIAIKLSSLLRLWLLEMFVIPISQIVLII